MPGIVSFYKHRLYKDRFQLIVTAPDRLNTTLNSRLREIVYKDYTRNEIIIAKSLSHASILTGVRVSDIENFLKRYSSKQIDKLLNGLVFRDLKQRVKPRSIFPEMEVKKSVKNYERLIILGMNPRSKIVSVTDNDNIIKFDNLKTCCQQLSFGVSDYKYLSKLLKEKSVVHYKKLTFKYIEHE